MNTLAFEAAGPPAGSAILLLHGFMGSRRDWAPVAELLAKTYRCLLVDLPGHGATGAPTDEKLWNPDGCVAALADLLEAAGGGSVVGYSLGGRLALQLAIEHPGVVAQTVVISASPGIAPEPERKARRDEDENLARRLEAEGLEPFLANWYRQPLFAALRQQPWFPEVLERRRRNDPRLLARSLRAMGTGRQRPFWDDLRALRAPLLCLAGELDRKFAVLAHDMVALCPRAAAVILRARGHALVEEDPETVARETAEFLGGRR